MFLEIVILNIIQKDNLSSKMSNLEVIQSPQISSAECKKFGLICQGILILIYSKSCSK